MGTQRGEEASEKRGGTLRAREEEDCWPCSLQVLVDLVRAVWPRVSHCGSTMVVLRICW